MKCKCKKKFAGKQNQSLFGNTQEGNINLN